MGVMKNSKIVFMRSRRVASFLDNFISYGQPSIGHEAVVPMDARMAGLHDIIEPLWND